MEYFLKLSEFIWPINLYKKCFENNLPPDTSHLSVNEAPSENGPTTDDSCSPESALKIVTLSGGTEKD